MRQREKESHVLQETPMDGGCCAPTLLLPFPEGLQVTSHKWINRIAKCLGVGAAMCDDTKATLGMGA